MYLLSQELVATKRSMLKSNEGIIFVDNSNTWIIEMN